MKKLINLLGFALVMGIVAFVALIAYREDFAIASVVDALTAYGFSVLSPLLDFSNFSLTFGLQLVGVGFYVIATLILCGLFLSKLKIIRAFISLLGLGFTLMVILLLLNGYHPEATSLANLGPESEFLPILLTPIQQPNPGLYASAYAGAIVGITLITMLFHILVIIDTFRHPFEKKPGKAVLVAKEETIIAEALSKFVVPNQVNLPIEGNAGNKSGESKVQLTSQSLMENTPIVVLPSSPALPEKQDVHKARQSVNQIKERIRSLIRLQLLQAKQQAMGVATQPTPTVSPTTPVPNESPTPPIKESPSLQAELPKEDLQQQLNQMVANELSQLEPKMKDQLATLINEELIKYDSLNREVLESLVAEKIETNLSQALEQIKIELQETIKSLVAENNQATTAPVQPVEARPSAPSLDAQTIETIIAQSPLAQRVQALEAKPEIKPVTAEGIINETQVKQLLEDPFRRIETLQQNIEQLTAQLNELKQHVSQPETQTQTQQSLIALHQELQTTKETLTQFQAESLAKTNALQEKLVQPIKVQTATEMVDVKVDEDRIVNIMKKYQTTLQPEASLSVIQSLVANEVKKAVVPASSGLSEAEVKKLIADAVAGLPQPEKVELPKVLNEEDVSKIVETKLPKVLNEEDIRKIVEAKLPKAEPGITEAVVLGLVANEVKKAVVPASSGLSEAEVKKLIADAVAGLPQAIPSRSDPNPPLPFVGLNAVTIPVIRKKQARAPENEKRAEQFKSVLPPETGLTRTGKKKIIRIPFQERMATADTVILNHYDELKNYLLSYQVKSRVSNAGDMFRLHKEEYAKMTIAGKGLKLYMALNPEDYKDSPIPVDDASDKKMYRDIPLVFKVKSELSLKRAKKLIDDLMAKKGLKQQEIPFLPWSKAFKR
ncbi:MAG: hypothetical protein ACO3H6_00610 [Bacilli bacterium]